MEMFIGYLGLAAGMFIMWVWLTDGAPNARNPKDGKDKVSVLCFHCGRMYDVGYKNVRTANYCNNCRD